MAELSSTVLLIGVVQGAFLLIALLRRPGVNPETRLTLVGLIAALTVLISGIGLRGVLPTALGDLVVLLNINTELAIGPLGLLFVRSLVRPERRLRARDGVHFLPLGLGLAAGIVTWALVGAPASTSILPRLDAYLGFFTAFKAAFLVAYGARAYRELSTALRGPRRFSSGRKLVDLGWVRRWFVAIGSMAIAIHAVELAGRLGLEAPFEADSLGSVLLTIMIFLGTAMVLVRPWVLSLRTKPEQQGGLHRTAQKLKAHLERERPWLDPDLKLGDLADAIGLSENRLSAAINDGLRSTFYSLLNDYRLAEFRRLAADPERKDWSVLDLAFESGFNSKAAFYRVCKESLGVPPAAFRRGLLQKSA